MKPEDLIALGKNTINIVCKSTSYGKFYIPAENKEDAMVGALFIIAGILLKKEKEK